MLDIHKAGTEYWPLSLSKNTYKRSDWRDKHHCRPPVSFYTAG